MSEVQLSKGYRSIVPKLQQLELEAPDVPTGVTLFYAMDPPHRGQSTRLMAQLEHIAPISGCHTSIIEDPDTPKTMITIVGLPQDLISAMELAIRMQHRDEHGR